MLYSSNVLETVAQCDVLLTEVSTEINNLIYKKATKEAQIAGSANNAGMIPAQIAIIETHITNKQAELAAATDEMEQRSITIEINSLTNQRLRLLNRMDSFEGLTLLDRQLDVAKMEKEIEALNDFKAMVETRKTAIQSSASAA